MPESGISYRRILQRLAEANVRYVVIGGVAMHLHGASNITFDMDISFSRDRANTEALARMLSEERARPRGFPPDLPFVLDSQTLRNSTNLTLETLLGDFDLLAQPEGVDDFEGLWNRAVVMEIEGLIVRVASLNDLVAMKRAANRAKDQNHLLLLEALQRLKSETPDG